MLALPLLSRLSQQKQGAVTRRWCQHQVKQQQAKVLGHLERYVWTLSHPVMEMPLQSVLDMIHCSSQVR